MSHDSQWRLDHMCPVILGEDKGYTRRAFLLYDGLHYDPLICPGVGVASSCGVFPISDVSVETEARQIAKEANQV